MANYKTKTWTANPSLLMTLFPADIPHERHIPQGQLTPSEAAILSRSPVALANMTKVYEKLCDYVSSDVSWVDKADDWRNGFWSRVIVSLAQCGLLEKAKDFNGLLQRLAASHAKTERVIYWSRILEFVVANCQENFYVFPATA